MGNVAADIGTQAVTQQIGLEIGNTEQKEAEEAAQRAEDEAKQEQYGPFACFVWLCSASTSWSSRCQFIGWIILGLLAPIFYGVYLNDDGSSLNWGYLLICCIAILLSAYATWNFSGLADWKKVAEDLRANTNELEERRDKISKQVERTKGELSKLAQIEEEQSISNAQLRAQNKLFTEWTESVYNKSNFNNSEAIKIKRDLQLQIEQINRKIIRSETMILYNALKVFEYQDDGEKGLNRFEFVKFIEILPIRYRDLFKKDGRSFDDYSGGDDVIDHKEFREFLDEFIIQEVQDLSNNHGIDLPLLRGGITEPLRAMSNGMDIDQDIKEEEFKLNEEFIEIQELELSGLIQGNIDNDNDGDIFVIDNDDDDDDDDGQIFVIDDDDHDDIDLDQL